MRESDLHRLIYERSRDLGPRVRVGPGDDAAVLLAHPPGHASAGHLLLLTVDQVIEGRHFAGPLTGLSLIDSVARKAIARSVSDIAAMAGAPCFALGTGALPPEFPQPAADRLFERMAHWARHWGCPLVGGDIASTRAASPLMLTVTVGGDAHASRGPVLRSGAGPGDTVWVTGRIGASLATGRHMTFEPRLREARWLADTLGDGLGAMIDVSDGLGRDAARIGTASGVLVEIEAARVPRTPEATTTALADGEDYELLFTTAPSVTLPARCPATGTELTPIGRIREGQGCTVIEPGGGRIDASAMGWDH